MALHGKRRPAYTVGHSTRSIEELIDMLAAHGVQAVADVRQHPRSRRLPHFNDEALMISLPAAGLEYISFRELGGRRKTRRDSPNTGWRNASFRGYADFMQGGEFEAALERFIELASRVPTAMMCAESLPWRCHRSLIADALVVRGWTVLNIMSAQKADEHKLTPFAQVDGSRLTYPEPRPALFGAG